MLLTMVLAGMFFSLAAASISLPLSPSGHIVVMVDLSPSTRGAMYRDPAFLRRRIAQLIGERPSGSTNSPRVDVIHFGQSNHAATMDSPLDEIPSERTVFDPPGADAVVLFSDGRFDRPAWSPPVFMALDAGLDQPVDASIRKLVWRDGAIDVTVQSDGSPSDPRDLVVTGDSRAVASSTRPVNPGQSVLAIPIDPSIGRWRAEISGKDLWPENDALSLDAPTPRSRQKWWIGQSARAPAGWTNLSTAALPMDEIDYLAASVIVLDNISAGELTPARIERLEEYVRDCGGSLVILGGDQSFGAGLYSGTGLERLSPLASVPPAPAQRWMFLMDFSGSMSNPAENLSNPPAPFGNSAIVSQSSLATAAVGGLLPRLPPGDAVTIGSFSDRITWWTTDKTARDLSKEPLVAPSGVAPSGPTNLEPALNEIAGGDSGGSALPVNLLLLSDADVRIDHPAELTAALSKRHVHVFVLALARGSGLGVLQQIASGTGGFLLDQSDPTGWPEAARQLLRGAMGDAIGTEAINVSFVNEAKNVPGAIVERWNRTWLKTGAAEIAQGQASMAPKSDSDAAARTMAAEWRVGLGKVSAAAFAAGEEQATALADLAAGAPVDPRLSVWVDPGSPLRVRVDARTPQEFIDHLTPLLRLVSADGGSGDDQLIPMKQTGPGRYEAATAAPRSPVVAVVTVDGEVAARIPVAGRYAAEFDAVGNDLDALNNLAKASGGRLILPNDTKPIDLPPTGEFDLSPWLAMCGAAAAGWALFLWKQKAAG